VTDVFTNGQTMPWYRLPRGGIAVGESTGLFCQVAVVAFGVHSSIVVPPTAL